MSTWSLSSIYPTDEAFEIDFGKASSFIEQPPKSLSSRILALQEAGMLIHELQSYVECLMAQDTGDSDAHTKNGTLSTLKAKNEAALYQLGIDLASLDTELFEKLLEEHAAIAFYLKELRFIAKKKSAKCSRRSDSSSRFRWISQFLGAVSNLYGQDTNQWPFYRQGV